MPPVEPFVFHIVGLRVVFLPGSRQSAQSRSVCHERSTQEEMVASQARHSLGGVGTGSAPRRGRGVRREWADGTSIQLRQSLASEIRAEAKGVPAAQAQGIGELKPPTDLLSLLPTFLIASARYPTTAFTVPPQRASAFGSPSNLIPDEAKFRPQLWLATTPKRSPRHTG